jgi:xanthine dehydrogenase accessory factor
MSHETFELIDGLRRTGRPATMATLVRTVGTTPRKEGTKMFVGENGDIFGSVTIGGCVDARVIEQAGQVLTSSTPSLLHLQLGDEEAWEIGLTCGGAVDVFVEPLTDPVASLYETARADWQAGRKVALATMIAASDCAAPIGSRLLIHDDGSVDGSWNAELTTLLARDAVGLLHSPGGSRTLSYTLADQSSIDVYVEVLRGPSTLVLFGASAVAIPLVAFANSLGFRTVVIDGRERFATRERFPKADDIRVGIVSEIAGQIQLDSTTAVVLVAHDYKIDVPVLEKALASDAPYIGLLGSRRRGAAILQILRENGISEERLTRVRVPIGLDLGGDTAAEIALSIVSEVVAVLHGKSGSALSRRLAAPTVDPAPQRP